MQKNLRNMSLSVYSKGNPPLSYFTLMDTDLLCRNASTKHLLKNKWKSFLEVHCLLKDLYCRFTDKKEQPLLRVRYRLHNFLSLMNNKRYNFKVAFYHKLLMCKHKILHISYTMQITNFRFCVWTFVRKSASRFF